MRRLVKSSNTNALYYVLLALFYPVSLLPFPLLYAISDGARWILFRVIGYRQRIIFDNLRQAFPEKTVPEIQQIQRAFEKGFCDQWIETIKMLSISKEALNRRMPGNWELLHQLGEEERDVYVLMGHQFNWEWAYLITQWSVAQTKAGFYLPVSDPAFDRMMKRVRSRGGGILISLKNLRTGLSALHGKRFVAGLIADQNPSQPDLALWISFMHREAPFFKGPEALARKANAVVVFAELVHWKRGRYEVRLTEVFRNPKEAAPDEITRTYVRFLEDCLRRQPANYLWSHRRWKHVRKPDTM